MTRVAVAIDYVDPSGRDIHECFWLDGDTEFVRVDHGRDAPIIAANVPRAHGPVRAQGEPLPSMPLGGQLVDAHGNHIRDTA